MGVRIPSRQEKKLARLTQPMEQMAQGRLNCTGTFTLAAGATSTTVKAPTVAPGTNIALMSQTANAAGALATTYVKASDVSAGQFIVSHANAVSTDRTFGYIAIG